MTSYGHKCYATMVLLTFYAAMDPVAAAISSTPIWLTFVIVLLFLVPLYFYFTAPPAIPLPGPTCYPFPLNFIIQAFALKKFKGNHKRLYELSKKYGKLFKCSSGGSQTICTTEPEVIKQIMVKEFHKFPNRGLPIELPPPLDSELFMARYPKWKRVRKVLAPAFSSAKMKGTVECVEDTADRMISKLRKLADTGESVEMSDLMSLCILDVILSSSFGVDTSDLQISEDRTLLNRSKALFNRPFLIALVSLFPWANFLVKYIDIIGNAGYFMDLASAIIRRRQETGLTSRYDVVQLMIDANKTVIDGESRLNDNEMKASSLSFLAAGHDTTTTTLICTSYYLATNQDVQEKLVQEIKLAREKSWESNYEFVQSIDYLDWVLKEVLRLCPPGHRHMRQCSEECVINGLKFPKGVRIHVLTYALHHDPDVWPDPFKFDPQRFSPEEEAKRHPYTYLPFGAGPRQCIGNRYSMMVMKVILVRVLEAGLRFKTSNDTKPLVLTSFNQLRPESPVYLAVEAQK